MIAFPFYQNSFKFNFYITLFASIFTTQDKEGMIKSVFGCFLLLTITMTTLAQDTLPNFTNKLIGNKAVLSWINTYDNITGINIQRSGDSLKNFITIGSILNAATPINGFMDSKEFLPNDQYYRLFLTFKGGNYIFTKAIRPVFDSLASIPPDYISREESDEIRRANRFRPSRFVYYSVEKENVVLYLPNATTQNIVYSFGKIVPGMPPLFWKYISLLRTISFSIK